MNKFSYLPSKKNLSCTANTPNRLESLKSTMITDMEGNPPIYITKKRTPTGEEIFVNNAMIIKSRSNIELKNESGHKQVNFNFFFLFFV